MKKFLIYWLPLIIWAGIIFFLSSIPDLKTDLDQDFLLRKIAHITEFAILTFLIARLITFYRRPKLSWKEISFYSAVFAIFYALTDEVHQNFVFGRYGSLVDVGIDSIGILLMSIVWYYRGRKIKKSVRN